MKDMQGASEGGCAHTSRPHGESTYMAHIMDAYYVALLAFVDVIAFCIADVTGCSIIACWLSLIHI